MNEFKLKEQICEIGRRVYAKGFAAANDGNITIRLNDREVLCTPTMVSKGYLKPEDICKVDYDGKQLAGVKKRTSEVLLHLAVYKARPDVNAVVHSHSPTVVPFTVTRAKLRPLLHNAGFLGLGVPLFEIRKSVGDGTDLMILTPNLGKDLAKKLGKDAAVVLMRGHGDSVVGPSLPNAVFRAYYTEINARQQLAAITIGGPINFMTRAEALTSNDAMLRASARPWALWRKTALRERP